MKNKYGIRLICAALIAAMLSCISTPLAYALQQTGNKIIIKTAEDFNELAKKCTLDTYSQGKTVILANDIDLDGEELSPIPTFGGSFDGSGYGISGIVIENSGSNLGVFRYIQKGGEVKNLNITADIKPGGTKKNIGGIVGENSGAIINCSFKGNLSAEVCAGGIAGINTVSGKISGCSAEGTITGEQLTGGIAGKNSGTVLSCRSSCSVNTTSREKQDKSINIEADPDTILENMETSSEEEEEKSIPGHSDTGGIAGYSDGIIQGCENYGEIGYPHIGYNIGGIVGRQAGFILGCKNYGTVYGRKDAGGIVGQAEPYIKLNSTEKGVLEDIKNELENLRELIEGLDGSVDTDSLSDSLDNISEYSKRAKNSSQELFDGASDFIDNNLAEINSKTAVLSDYLKKLPPVFDSIADSSKDAEKACDKLREAASEFEITVPDKISDGLYEIESALSQLSRASEDMGIAASYAQDAIKYLDDAIIMNDESAVKKALTNMSAASEKMAAANKKAQQAVDKIKAVAEEKPDSIGTIVSDVQTFKEQLGILSEALNEKGEALKTLSSGLKTVAGNTSVDFRSLQKAGKSVFNAADSLTQAMLRMESALSQMSDGVTDIRSKADAFGENIEEQVNGFADKAEEAFDMLTAASDKLSDAVSQIRDIADEISEEEPIQFIPLGDDFRKSSDDLFDSLGDISNELKNVKSSVSDSSRTVKDKIDEVYDKFNLILELTADEFDYVSSRNEDYDISGLIEDVSDEDIVNTKQGKILTCTNFGSVEADRNAGGIAGAMSIEYAQDPEDEFEKPSVLNFTYQTKAVLQKCVNEGSITGKKDCIGGIAGRMTIGTVYDCENYANVESTGGSYAGGIAGWGKSSIRKCYSKCRIKSKSISGGIAGRAERVTACYSIVTTEADESIGAIIGEAVDRSNIRGCFYVDNGIGGIDGISYSGCAEPISYERLKAVSGIPTRFSGFSVTFKAEGKTVEILPVQYGGSTAAITYPEVPGKKGYYGKWKKPESPTVTEDITIEAEYKPWITVLESKETNSTGKLSLALAEGSFTDEASFHVTESKIKPPVTAKIDEELKVWDLRLYSTDATEDTVLPVRLINDKKMKACVWVYTDSGWEETKAGTRGKYLLLDLKGAENTVCVLYKPVGQSILYAVLTVALLLSAAVPIILLRKRKKSRKMGKPPKKGNGKAV